MKTIVSYKRMRTMVALTLSPAILSSSSSFFSFFVSLPVVARPPLPPLSLSHFPWLLALLFLFLFSSQKVIEVLQAPPLGHHPARLSPRISPRSIITIIKLLSPLHWSLMFGSTTIRLTITWFSSTTTIIVTHDPLMMSSSLTTTTVN